MAELKFDVLKLFKSTIRIDEWAAYYMGIDPGLSGGIGIVTEDGKGSMTFSMPKTHEEILWLFRYLNTEKLMFAMMEKVNAGQSFGRKACFTFGHNVGYLEMALHAAKIPWDSVASGKWMRKMNCLTGGDKVVTRQKAQQMFPNAKTIGTTRLTDKVCEALLIAEYCRKLRLGLF